MNQNTESPTQGGNEKYNSALQQNAFYILGVTTRDTRKVIVEAADDKSLELDHGFCQKARSDLTNPRTRLSVEMGWLLGVSPNKVSHLIDQLVTSPDSIPHEKVLPALAHANLMAAAFGKIDTNSSSKDLAKFIIQYNAYGFSDR